MSEFTYSWKSDLGCSKPGCGYPDGKPCIGCGRVMTLADFIKESGKFRQQRDKAEQLLKLATEERDTALKQVEELTHWLYRITLKIQTTDFESHRAEAFQEAYQLYVKYNADRFDPNYENRMKAITTAMKEKA